MTDEELAKTLPQLKWFLLLSLVPWLLILFGKQVGLSFIFGIVAFLALLLTPLISLWFAIPIAKLMRQSIVAHVVFSLVVPMGYLASGILLFCSATKHLTGTSEPH
jgi:hypothetical protein